MLTSLKNALRRRIIQHYGVGSTQIPSALQRLRINNFSPTHIFDVGAYTGEFAKTCRSIWPNAKLTCFEVLPHRVKELRAWSAMDGRTDVIECLLGEHVRSNVRFHEKETASSVLDDHIPHSGPVECYPMRTIDELIATSNIRPPEFLKLDVQGYEYEVLMGGKNTLRDIEVILAEANLLDLYKGAHLLDDLIALLREHGFVAYDICEFHRRPLDAALWQADFIFVPEASQLRKDKRWTI
jgi:FkbM family methyltransferase